MAVRFSERPTSSRRAFPRVRRRERFLLEGVVAVRIAAAQERIETTGEVRGKEEETPPLHLAHVHPLVGARAVERGGRASEYDVPQREGGRASPHRDEVAENPGDGWPVQLEHPADAPYLAPNTGNGDEEESQQRHG